MTYQIINTSSLTSKQKKIWHVGELVMSVYKTYTENSQPCIYVHKIDDNPKFACTREDYKHVVLINKSDIVPVYRQIALIGGN